MMLRDVPIGATECLRFGSDRIDRPCVREIASVRIMCIFKSMFLLSLCTRCDCEISLSLSLRGSVRSQRDFDFFPLEWRLCVRVVSIYLGEFICILDDTIMIYNTYLLHVYIDNMYF